jgi:hypothetical protein
MRRMIERVRAVLVTPDGCLLVRRDRISEEIAGMTDITSLLHVLEPGAGDKRQYLYLGRIT